jgi:tape measure domain-containing protein
MQDLQTSFKVMLGSQEKAKKMTQDLITMGAKTPFESSQLAEYTKTMLSFGYTQKNVLPIMSRLGDISLGNNEKMSSLTRTMGQINALGKLQGGDLNQLIGQGWNPLNAIMKKTGETTEQVRKRMSAGKVAYKEVEQALVDATSKGGQFYKGMDEGAKTLSGMLSTLQDNFSMLAGELTKPIFDGLMSIMPPFLGMLGKITDTFKNLSSPVKGIILGVAGLTASIGPLLVVGSVLITMLGGLVGAVSTIVGVIGTIGLPVIAAVIGGIINFTVVIGAAVAAVVYFVNKFIPIIDTLKLFKNLVTSDVKGSLNILTEKFGMSGSAANKLVSRFIDVKNKAWQIFQVIKENLSPAFGVIKESIMNAITGFDSFNNSTGETRKNTIGLFTGIIKPIQNFLNHIYKTLDSFGLIPTKVKYANDKTAATFIELNAKVKKSNTELVSFHKNSSDMMILTNKKQYETIHKNTQKAMENEIKFISQQMNKKKNTQLKAAQELFKSTDVLTDQHEKSMLKRIEQRYKDEENSLKEMHRKIKEIEDKALKENRIMTEEEYNKRNNLMQQIENRAVTVITTSKAKQKAILEEAKSASIKISTDEAMGIVVQANLAYDKTIATARKKKQDTIANALMLRDNLMEISQKEYENYVKTANDEYKAVTGKAKLTKDQTISLANQKANGVLTPAQREAREITTQSEKIKKVATALWTDLKAELPALATQMVDAIMEILGTYFKTQVDNAMIDVGNSIKNFMRQGMPTGLKWTVPENKQKSYISKPTSPSANKDYYSTYRPGAMGRAYATGTRFASGGLSLVGERGAELVNIPRGAQVYNNQKTQSMINTGGGTKEIIINVYETSNAYETANEIAKRFRVGGLQ